MQIVARGVRNNLRSTLDADGNIWISDVQWVTREVSDEALESCFVRLMFSILT
jgi:hypothetical protein